MIINMQSGGVVPERILDAQTITPGTEDQTIEELSFLRGKLTVKGDADLKAENIRKGVELFGVNGSFEHEEDPNLIPGNIRKDVEILGVKGTMSANEVTEKSGSYTPTSYGDFKTNIPHGMGEKPTYAGVTEMYLSANYIGEYYSVNVSADETNITITTSLSKSTSNTIKWFAVLIK